MDFLLKRIPSISEFDSEIEGTGLSEGDSLGPVMFDLNVEELKVKFKGIL